MGVGGQHHTQPALPRESDTVPAVQQAGLALGPI
jgi:hypothetical protein